MRSTIESPSTRTMPAIASALPDVNDGTNHRNHAPDQEGEPHMDAFASRVRPKHRDREQGQAERQPGMRRPGDRLIQLRPIRSARAISPATIDAWNKGDS